MDFSKLLSYQSLKCIAASLDYNIRIQLTKRCPFFKTVHKEAPAKINKISITTTEIKIESTSYYMGFRYQGYLCHCITREGARTVELFKKTTDVPQAIDYLVQVLLGKKQESRIGETLKPYQLHVNYLSIGGDEFRYPFVNTVRNLTIIDTSNLNGLLHITIPKIRIQKPWTPIDIIISLARMAEQDLTRPVHYTIELGSEEAYSTAASHLTDRHEWVNNEIFLNGRISRRFKRNCLKAQNLEVNVYYDEMEDGVTHERECSAHIVVSKKAPMIIGN